MLEDQINRRICNHQDSTIRHTQTSLASLASQLIQPDTHLRIEVAGSFRRSKSLRKRRKPRNTNSKRSRYLAHSKGTQSRPPRPLFKGPTEPRVGLYSRRPQLNCPRSANYSTRPVPGLQSLP